MTAVTDATLVIETLIGRTLTAQQLQNIGLNYKKSDPYGVGNFVDPENPTNEELAQCFLDNVLADCKEVVKRGATATASVTFRTGIDTAVTTAVADLE